MNREDLGCFGALLESELEEVDTQLGVSLPEGENTNHSHMAEAASATEQRMLASALRGLLKTKREQVLLALKRINDGTYGICELCGEEINLDRLASIPHTPICFLCARAT